MKILQTIQDVLFPDQGIGRQRRVWLAYAAAPLLVGAMLFIRLVLMRYKVGEPPSLVLFLIPIVVCAYLGGAGPGLLATALSALATAYYLLPPLHNLAISNRLLATQWLTFLGIGVLVSVLMESAHRSRRRAEVSRIEQTVTLSSIGDAVVTTDAHGVITFMNPEAAHLTGWHWADAVGKDLAEVLRLVNEDTGAAVEDPIQNVIRAGARVAMAERTILLSRDGRKIPIADSGAPIKTREGSLQGVVLVFRDATESRRAETALRDELALRNQIAGIADTAPGVIHSFRLKPNGSVCFPYASPRITDIFGLKPEKLAEDGSLVFGLLHPDDLARVQEAMRESRNTMQQWHDEFRVIHPQRGEIWVEGRSVPRREPDGSILWQGFLADVTERKKAEELLRESERQLRLVTDSMPALVAYIDAEYRYRFANKKYQEWFEAAPWEIVGRTVAEVMGENGFREIKDQADRALRGELLTFETSREFKNSVRRELQATYAPDVARDGKVNGFYALIVDITATKRAEAEVRDKDRILREAMEASRLVAWESDLTTGELKESGPVQEMFFRPDGASPPTPENWFENVHPEDRELVQRNMKAAIAGGAAYNVEFRTRSGPHGEFHWVAAVGEVERDESDKPVRIRGIAMDVTQKKFAEEALRTSQTQLKAALEAGGMGIWVSDMLSDRVWLDETSLKHWGLERSQTRDWAVEALRAMVHPQDTARLKTVREALQQGGVETANEFRVVRPDGKIVWLSAKGRAERDNAGKPMRQVGVLMDITERKRNEEIQMRSQKLEALGTLSGGIAHDFNNILLAINENARMAAEDLPADHEIQESLQQIRKAGQRAKDLVKQILAFSRPSEEEKKLMELAPVVEEALKLVRATVPATIRFETDFARKVPAVIADTSQIYQIIVNLATNAAHAIGSKPGLIEVRMSPLTADADQARLTPGLNAGDYLLLSVSDDGCGMDMATMDRVFDPFFTTKPHGQGTGLGLSVVHGIMKGHGGAISLYSEVGKGTVFNLYFPAAGEIKAESAAPLKDLKMPTGGLRVMYVDDEEALVNLAGRALRRMGYQVAGFTDPREALQAFTATPDAFDIVVTDLAMPHITGFELVRKLQAVRPEIPIVLTSGYVRPADEELAAEYGVRDIVLKPNSVEDLGHVLDRLFRGSGSPPVAPESVRLPK